MTKKQKKAEVEMFGVDLVWRHSKKQCEFCDRKSSSQLKLLWGNMCGHMCRKCLGFFVDSATRTLANFSWFATAHKASRHEFRVSERKD